MKRDQRGLDRKHQEQEDGSDPDEGRVVSGDLGHPHGEVGHVQRAGHSVDRTEREEKQRGAEQVVDHILHAGLQPLLPAAVNHESVGRDQQDLEEHEEVEKVTGQEGAEQSHHLELQERMEVAPATVPTRPDGVEQPRPVRSPPSTRA